MTHPPSAHQPHWWTLTDQIEPDELFEALQSRSASAERLTAAVEAGRYPELAEKRHEEVSFFLDGAMTPELVPMFDAFGILAARLNRGSPRLETQLRRGLQDEGVSEPGTERIVIAAVEYGSRARRTISEVDYRQRRFAARVLGPARRNLGNERTTQVLKNREFGELAKQAGMPETEVAELYETWRRDPWVEAGVAALIDLEEALPESDWQALRQFLFHRIAPEISFDHFSEGAYR